MLNETTYRLFIALCGEKNKKMHARIIHHGQKVIVVSIQS